MLKFLNNRRTIRKYSDKEISDEKLYEMLETASHASTTGNMQLYSVIISKDKEEKEEKEKRRKNREENH